MKYILILLTTMLFSCNGMYPVYNGAVVKQIKLDASSNNAFYYTSNGYFYAPKTLYNVGDTVWFTKK